jgi:hypothetical protein
MASSEGLIGRAATTALIPTSELASRARQRDFIEQPLARRIEPLERSAAQFLIAEHFGEVKIAHGLRCQ